MLAKFFLAVFIGIFVRDHCMFAQNLENFVSKVTTITHRISASTALNELYARCVTECAQKCSHNTFCRSFFFNKDRKICQLQDVLFENYYQLGRLRNTRYYKMNKVLSNFTCPLATPNTTYNTVLLSDNTDFTYRVVLSLETKAAAEAACIAEGAWLVRVLTEEIMQTLVTVFTSCPGFVNLDEYWIDGTNANVTDFFNVTQWTTSVGVPLTYQFWAPMKPDFPDTEHCISLWTDGGYMWNDRKCSDSYYYVCVK